MLPRIPHCIALIKHHGSGQCQHCKGTSRFGGRSASNGEELLDVDRPELRRGEPDMTVGTSGFEYALGSGSVTVTLVSLETVTCTYTDKLTPLAGKLLIGKKTIGGTDTFGFAVRPANEPGADPVARRRAPPASPLFRCPSTAARSGSTPIATPSANGFRARGGEWKQTDADCYAGRSLAGRAAPVGDGADSRSRSTSPPRKGRSACSRTRSYRPGRSQSPRPRWAPRDRPASRSSRWTAHRGSTAKRARPPRRVCRSSRAVTRGGRCRSAATRSRSIAPHRRPMATGG